MCDAIPGSCAHPAVAPAVNYETWARIHASCRRHFLRDAGLMDAVNERCAPCASGPRQ